MQGDMRRYVVELVGTFFLTLAISFTGNPLAIGTMLMIIYYVGYHVSGGHFNPAVTLAVYMRGFSANLVPWYMVSQVLGACLALWLLKLVTDNVFVPELLTEIPLLLLIITEMLLTALFALVVLTVTTGQRYRTTAIDGAAIGLGLTAVAFIGGLFNPAVAVASMICSMIHSEPVMMNNLLVHVVGPLLGGVIAAYSFAYLHPNE